MHLVARNGKHRATWDVRCPLRISRNKAQVQLAAARFSMQSHAAATRNGICGWQTPTGTHDSHV